MHEKIGYVPYSPDLTQVADRRRFPYFSKRKNVRFSIAETDKKYDIIILNASSNLTKWLRHKKGNPKTVYIFEMVDSLIHQTDYLNLLFKGTGRFLLGKEAYPSFIHRNLLIQWIKKADFVICSSPVTLKIVRQWNKNTLFNLDYQQEEYHFLKEDYWVEGKMKLFWEGQGVVLPQLLYYEDLFKKINSFCELHIVTSDNFPRWGQFFKQDTISFLKRLPIRSFFHLWSMEKNPELFSTFDCGIIPINPRDKYAWNKPANKLISFWFSGIPTLTSKTPAYCEIGRQTQSDFLCETTADWIEKLNRIRDMSSDERKNMAIRNHQFAENLFSNEILDKFWLDLFEEAISLFKERNKK